MMKFYMNTINAIFVMLSLFGVYDLNARLVKIVIFVSLVMMLVFIELI